MRAVNLERFALAGLLLPAVITAVVLLLAWVSRERAEQAARGWLGALALGGAYALGQAVAFGGLPSLPPIQASDAIFWLAVGSTILAAVESLFGVPRWPQRLLRLAFCLAVPWLLLARLIERGGVSEPVLTVGGLAFALLVLWLALAAWSERCAGASIPLVLWWVTSAGSIALLLSGSIVYAKFAGILAATLGACAVVAWLRPAFLLGAGAAGVVVTLDACLWIAGVWISELPATVAILLALGPLLSMAGELGPVARLSPRKAVLARLVLSSLSLLPALFLAWVEAPPPAGY